LINFAAEQSEAPDGMQHGCNISAAAPAAEATQLSKQA
jgi:hypothetical protein